MRASVQAMMCSVEMLEEIETLNEEQSSRFPPIHVGVGVSTGVVVAGEIGTPQRRQYTIIGTTVNVAAELGSETRHALGSAPLLFSRETVRHSGLMAHPMRAQVLAERAIGIPGFADKTTAYAPEPAGFPKLRHYLEEILQRSAEASA